MNRLSLCIPYYLNPGMLAQQYRAWAAWPDGLKHLVEVILVDDGSPHHPAAGVPRPEGLPALTILRMLKDVRWNQDACRNLAVDHAAHDWLLLTDIDHLAPVATLERLVFGPLRPGVAYRFARKSMPDEKGLAFDAAMQRLAPYKFHPNSWCIERAAYRAFGGYDERFAGYYGTDAMFRDSIKRQCDVEDLPEWLIRVPRDVAPDASTTSYGRKEACDQAAIPRIKAAIAQLPEAWRRPQRMGFEFERVL